MIEEVLQRILVEDPDNDDGNDIIIIPSETAKANDGEKGNYNTLNNDIFYHAVLLSKLRCA